MNTLSEFKRGDTFLLSCVYKVDGDPAPIDNLTITSQVRQANGALVTDLVAEEVIGEVGQFLLTPDTETDTWPLDVLQCDIEITDDGFVRSSETVYIPVVKDITR
jgi:hypothetical protein